MSINIIENAISKLANNMRRYAEENINFKRMFLVDKEESIHNLDRSFESVLEAFHSLYDVDKKNYDYFEYGDTSLIILMRNAIHHKNHDLFHSWNEYMQLKGGLEKHLGAEFLLFNHQMPKAIIVMRQYYKLEDFLHKLTLDVNSVYYDEKFCKNNQKHLNSFNRDLKFEKMIIQSKSEGYPLKQVYINVVPILISAILRVFKDLNGRGVSFIGFDAEVYLKAFTTDIEVNLDILEFNKIKILL